jgi:hypothetical protein
VVFVITVYLEVPNRYGNGQDWEVGPFFFQNVQEARQAMAQLLYPQLESWLGADIV